MLIAIDDYRHIPYNAFSQFFDRRDVTHFLGDYKGAGAVSVPAKYPSLPCEFLPYIPSFSDVPPACQGNLFQMNLFEYLNPKCSKPFFLLLRSF